MQRLYLAALTRRSEHAPGSALPRLAALPPPAHAGASFCHPAKLLAHCAPPPRKAPAPATARRSRDGRGLARGFSAPRRWTRLGVRSPLGRGGMVLACWPQSKPRLPVGGQPKGRAERPALFAAAILSPSSLFPLSCFCRVRKPPRNGAASARALKRRNAVRQKQSRSNQCYALTPPLRRQSANNGS